MPETLEKRVDAVERRLAELDAILGSGPRKKDWLSTVGTWREDELSREAERLGREYREGLKDSDERAGA